MHKDFLWQPEKNALINDLLSVHIQDMSFYLASSLRLRTINKMKFDEEKLFLK